MLNVLDQTADVAKNTLQEASSKWHLIKDSDEGRAFKDQAKTMPKPDVATMTTVQMSQFVKYQFKKLSRVVSIF